MESDNLKKGSAPAVEKMIKIIELLAYHPTGYNYTEIAKLTDTPFNSVYRICQELEAKKYIVKADGLLHIGPAFYIIGKAAESQMQLIPIARQYMNELALLTGETVQLSKLNDSQNLILVDQIESKHQIRMSISVGSEMATHASAFGKCILAWDDWQTYGKREMTRFTPNTITDIDTLAKELECIRRKGYALDDGEYTEGIRCIGAPIFGADGRCIASIGVMYLLYRFNDEIEERGIRVVTEAAQSISRLLRDGNITEW